ncbi:uncharacterized protein BCR38DRAFT_409525 [Pseudomassariella vexata]|uniref:Pentatricopeptide repeat domain-containing protein n=1 Tax=Pseudomassariella vexata TaxID=1141098 RepID=A0A1Y2DYE0_9PEZI|nr:uncharacterized protein BCR38DRAFT_409525 [Pseudomassariella vexata]ORY64126.1 hypothetical protein BCR38DRAFT_409525 [Pseudomassariella vexata]
MQALWSRAAQAQSSCCCRICLHSTTALARRATTATSRQRATAADIFTACYTTILGTAAVLDAKRKEDRRRELDQKLEHARAALGSLATQEAPSSQVDDDYHENFPSHNTDDPRGKNGSSEEREAQSTADLLDELGRLAMAIHPSRPRSSWLHTQIDWVGVESAIAAEEKNPKISLRHPKSERQLELTTHTVEALVRHLLHRSRYPVGPDGRSVPAAAEDWKGDRLLDEVTELQDSPHYPSFEHPHTDPAAATEARNLLSESFRRIFNRTTSSKEMVGKICYNLLLSTTPPNIHNYNTLIAGFNRVERPDLAQAVIDSYLDNVRWPATQQTMVCLLNHARGTNNLEHFREIIGRMRGVTEDGLHFRIMSREAIYNDQGWLWADKLAASRKCAYVQKARRGNQVFDSLIRGWLHFEKIGAASMSFVACIRNGRMISIDTIHELLTECLSHQDQQAARAMLKGLAKNFEKFEALIEHIIAQASTRMARKIADMFNTLFDLCEMPYRPLIGSVRRSLIDVAERFRYLNATMLEKLDKENISASISDTGKALQDQVAEAFASVDGKTSMWQLDTKLSSHSRKVARLAALFKRCRVLEEKTKRLDVHVKVELIKQRSGLDLDPRSRLPPIDWVNRLPNQGYPALFYAVQSIQLTSEPLAKNDIKAQILQAIPDKQLAKLLLKTTTGANLGLGTLISLHRWKPSCLGETSNLPASPTVAMQLEEQVLKAEEVTKAILFTHLRLRGQEQIRHRYQTWHDVPLSRLFTRYNLEMHRRWAQFSGIESEWESANNELETTEAVLAKLGHTVEEALIDERSREHGCTPLYGGDRGLPTGHGALSIVSQRHSASRLAAQSA